jgi:dethiobiotin synthetase
MRGLFVTGTDTGVGKTLAACALLHALRARACAVAGFKPVASGCAHTPLGWRNDDALALQCASDPEPTYADVNPFALPEPTAPQIAARMAGIAVSLPPLLDAFERLSGHARCVVAEGAGGWLAPMGDGVEQSDLVRALELPVVLVVALRLGCLNHARLTARAIEADGCRLAGWIGSSVDADLAHRDAYLALLRDALPAPCWGVLPHVPDADAAAMAPHLHLPDKL